MWKQAILRVSCASMRGRGERRKRNAHLDELGALWYERSMATKQKKRVPPSTAPKGRKPNGAAFSPQRKKLTEEIIKAILEHIADGGSVSSGLRAHGLSKGVWWEWANNPENVDRYARARESCAHSHVDRIMEIANQVEDGTLSPEQGRVSADVRKWTAARLNFAAYGDKSQQEVTVKASVSAEPMTPEEWEREYCDK